MRYNLSGSSRYKYIDHFNLLITQSISILPCSNATQGVQVLMYSFFFFFLRTQKQRNVGSCVNLTNVLFVYEFFFFFFCWAFCFLNENMSWKKEQYVCFRRDYSWQRAVNKWNLRLEAFFLEFLFLDIFFYIMWFLLFFSD